MKPTIAAMVSVLGLSLTDKEKYLLSTYQPMGVTLFKRNIDTPEQVKKLTHDIREVIGRSDVLIATDQEGGRVCRFEPPYFNRYMSQYAIGSLTGNDRSQASFCHARLIADDLLDLGVNLNYAPCLDVRYSETAPVLSSRCFADNPEVVATCGKVMIETYRENGIIPCMKHMPGHGRVAVDPHLHLPCLTHSLSELEHDFKPFIENAPFCPMGMTAHIVLPEIDAELPVTQSAVGIQTLIRDKIGFDGFLISDAIDMRALKGTLSEKTQSILEAGCDAVCYCLGDTEELEVVLKSANPLVDKSLERLQECLKILENKPNKMDKSEMRKEYETLSVKAVHPVEDYDAVEVLNQLRAKKSG